MAAQWEQGNAARQPEYDANPFQPIDYQARLRGAGKKNTAQQQNGMAYQPGQLYGRTAAAPARVEPPVYSPPPMPAPAQEVPSYLQQPAYGQDQPRRRSQRAQSQPEAQPGFMPQQAQPGALYSAEMFSHQPTAVMPSGYDDTPFAQRGDEIAAFFAQEPQPEEEYQEYPEAYADEPVWRDPFEPAAPPEDDVKRKPAPKKTQPQSKPPVRVGRVLALVAAAAMLLFCVLAGGRIALTLNQSDQALQAAREDWREQNGGELLNAGARVDLPPAGQTFVPTATPEPTPFVPTPSPTPIIPINDPAAVGLAGMAGVTAAELTPPPTATPNPRTRQTTYPKNPLNNTLESMQPLVEGNPDVVGRLVIDGVLDEVVVQRNNTYYLTHNSLGMTSAGGAVFADESCSLRMPPENLLLRAQGSIPGKAFAPLWKFVEGGSTFVSGAVTATLTTLYEEERYVLFAVIVAAGDPKNEGYFNYGSHPTFTTDASMLEYVASARARSLYNFNVDVQAGDRLLTLATIGDENALVLMYRMVREGEMFR